MSFNVFFGAGAAGAGDDEEASLTLLSSGSVGQQTHNDMALAIPDP